jgi:hypothetical protein
LKEKNLKSYDDKIVKNLKLATKLDKSSMDKIINNNKYDVVMYVVDTDYDQVSENLSKYINKLGQRFKTLGIKSVLFTYYDTNENGILNYEGVTYKKGDIVMYPSSSKTPVYYKERLTVLRLMKWVEKTAEIRIRLPEVPHIDLELQEDYYKKKSVLESYDENASKNDFEVDDLINMDFDKLKVGDNNENKKTDL